MEVWQKARVRQTDTIISAMVNLKFKNLCLVGLHRVYFWDANTGVLNKTYDSEYIDAFIFLSIVIIYAFPVDIKCFPSSNSQDTPSGQWGGGDCMLFGGCWQPSYLRR